MTGRFFKAVLFVALLAGAAEGAARCVRPFVHERGYQQTALPDPAALFSYDPLDVAHPYLGFVRNHDLDERHNRFGFFGPEPVFERAPDEVIVGIFGGSVAERLACSGELTARLKDIERFRGKEIRLFSTAMGGYKQPQQLMALIYLLALGARMDVVINLDGFNEITLPALENVPAHVAVSYPRQWVFYARKYLNTEAVLLLERIRRFRSHRARVLSLKRVPVLRASRMAELLLTVADNRLTGTLMRDTERLMKAVSAHTADFQVTGPPVSGKREPWDIIRESAGVWARSSEQMARVCEANGIAYFHFLQPNIFLPGAKELSPDEVRIAEEPALEGYRDLVQEGYPELSLKGEKLAAGGIPFYDLSRVFSAEKETLYVDLCHVTTPGNRILARHIAAAIAQGIPDDALPALQDR